MNKMTHTPGPPPTFTCESRLEAPAAEVFAWHERPGAFERLSPPWESVRLVQRPENLRDGSRAIIRMRIGPLPRTWVAEHRDYIAGRQFRDVQISGPFRRWEHTHEVLPAGEAACVLSDRILYDLPLGPVGRLFGGGAARRQLERMFTFRHETMRQDLSLHATAARPLRVAVTGASGLLGAQLCAFLGTGGHDVVRLVRGAGEAGPDTARWDPAAGTIAAEALEGLDAVVHLAGENIAGGRWNEARKRRILASREEGTGLMARTLAGLARPPAVLVCASAVGIYGDRGAEVLTEASRPGTGFLAEVCRAWEGACEPARAAGVRVANLRFGAILTPAGGALRKLRVPFGLGLGGRIGSGTQSMSWVSIDDAVGAVHHAIVQETLAGPVNVVAPEQVTNAGFTRTLGRVLRRWTLAPLPACVARLALGEMADEVLLASQRVVPARLEATGYAFLQPTLEGALRRLLGRPARG